MNDRPPADSDQQPIVEPQVAPDGTGPNSNASRRPQVSLFSVILTVTAASVWGGYFAAKTRSDRLETEIVTLRKVARPFFVANPAELAIAKRLPKKYGQLIWDVYTPTMQAGVVRLCVAMDGIPDEIPSSSRLWPFAALDSVELPPGEHSIELQYDQNSSTLRVLVDEVVRIRETRPPDWEPGRGSSSHGKPPNGGALEFPAVLHVRRFMQLTGENNSSARVPPSGPANGIVLWLERSASPDLQDE